MSNECQYSQVQKQNKIYAANDTDSIKVDRVIENLLTIIKLPKTKKLYLTKTKKVDFAIADFYRTDFFILKAKKDFIHL